MRRFIKKAINRNRNATPGYKPKEIPILLQRHFISLFIFVLFIMARKWNQPKYYQQMNVIKMWYIYTMEFHSRIKNDEIADGATKCYTEDSRLRKIKHVFFFTCESNFEFLYLCV